MLGDRKTLVLTLAIASVAAAVSEAGILTITAQAATNLVNGVERVHLHVGPVQLDTGVGTLLFCALGLAVIRLLLQGILSYFPALIAGEVQAQLRIDLLSAFTDASWELQSQDLEGHFQELMTNQITMASQGALQATGLFVSLCTFSVLALSAFALNVTAAFAVLAAAVLLFMVLRPLSARGAGLARSLSLAQIEYAGAVGEANGVAEETRVFGVGEAQRVRVRGFVTSARQVFVQTQTLGRAVPNIYQSAIYLILVGGLIAIDKAHVGNFSSLGAVVLLLVRASTYGQQLQGSYQFVRQALPFIERVQDATVRYRDSRARPGTERIDDVQTLAFDQVGYGYRQDEPVLSGVTFHVTRGETIGIVGPSGAGKSTMVQILLGLRAPDTGRYLINGKPAEMYTRQDWHRRVAYVPQQPRLIYASVAENVRFFRTITDEAVERACRLARIHEDIMSWPEGYHTMVGPRADAVSGGQQQRICLARSLAAEPQVLVLDEPTSALDPRSEVLVQESLEALTGEITVFIIAHRMSTLSICDRVIVMLDGRLDAFDTLQALRESNSYYRLASSISANSSPAG